MLNRRQFTILATAAAGFPARAVAAGTTIAFYDGIGPVLSVYGLDVQAASLTARMSVTLPAKVQYAWPHPSRKFLYVASGNETPGDSSGFISAFRVDPQDGALTAHGAARPLADRPVHISTDHSGRFLLVAYFMPSRVTVHHINADGTVGDEIPQPPELDVGNYAHQIRATPAGSTVTLVTRGSDAFKTQAETPGAIKVFRFAQGRLSNLQSLQPPGSNGYGFGPRHLDFHPTLPLVYVSLERNNRLDVYRRNPDGTLSPQALFQASTLSDAGDFHGGGGPSAVHVHPGGRFVYVPNRGSQTIDFNGQKISNGGFNSVAVFSIDQKTGEPKLIQQAAAHGFELRTFTIDPSGKLLIAASQMPLLVRDGDTISNVSAGLSFYRIGDDGRLDFLHKQDMDTSSGTQFWCGLLSMP